MTLNLNMKTIVIDDMMAMRKIVMKMLKEFGFTNITEADDGASAWPLIEGAAAAGEPFDFIVSDWNMPLMNGLDLLVKVRATEEIKKTPFLMVTTEAEQLNIAKAIELGMSNSVMKPFSEEVLKDKIDMVFNK